MHKAIILTLLAASFGFDLFKSQLYDWLMKRSLETFRRSDLVFILLNFGFSILPVILKLLATGSIGPTFKFYFFVLWVPVVALSFSVFRNQKEAILTSLLLIGAFIVSFISYPSNPPMDFRRQIVHQLDAWLILAVLVSLVLQIILPKLKNKVSR